ncbi:MAG: histone deacetylase [Candidatus Aminicenantes bacterium]|nr:histone deacetylase [Candidatus Aminicenantes bacterium]
MKIRNLWPRLRAKTSRGSPRGPLIFVYNNIYWMIPLQSHVFSPKKYRLLYEEVIRLGIKKNQLILSRLATYEELCLVHTEKYLKKIFQGDFSSSEVQRLEIPFTSEIKEFSLLTVGGTIQAAEWALKTGIAVHLGGGFHHAFPDHGEGFCLLNDIAVAVEKLLQEKKISKAMIIDLDVHQGNGTAFIFAHRSEVFTFSLHQMDLYPAQKEKSTLDVGLWSGDGDLVYLQALKAHFPRIVDEFRPEILFYLAGADPFARDQLGGLKLTKNALQERDRLIIFETRKRQIPLAILLGGGYAFDVNDTVDIHLQTIKIARQTTRPWPLFRRKKSYFSKDQKS